MKRLPRNQRVLVVEDEEDTRTMVGWVLKDLGYEIDLAGDGWVAIEKIEAHRPDLVILDLVLPGVDGWSFLEQLKVFSEPPPVVVMTACGDSDSFACAVREGAAGYVFKPFRIGNLISTCERLLRASRRRVDPADERRREPRRVLALELDAHAPERSLRARGKLVDLSHGGAQLDLASPLEPGERVRVALQIPDRQEPFVSLDARVCWRGPAEMGFPHGLTFEKLAPEAARQLRDMLSPA